MLRLSLAPITILTAWTRASAILFLVYLSLGMLSDIFDGILARRLGVATDRLRRFDSLTDVIFYGAVFTAIWLVHPQIIRADAMPLAALLTLELLGQCLSYAWTGKPAAVHSYLAKAWGICLFLASCEALVRGAAGVFFHIVLLSGFVVYAEWISIVLLTRGRGIDVPSVFCIRARNVIATEAAR